MASSLESEKNRTPLSRAKRLAFRLVALLLGVFFGILIAEVYLRVAGYSSPELYTADDALGYRLIPGVSGWYTKEGKNFVAINSAGFHDSERSVEKPAGTYRIAVIGDSYVEALQVDREEAFTAKLQERLASCSVRGGRNIEVVSFGVSGYGTAQELIMLRDVVIAYRPDAVLLLVTTNNDITDNIREMKGSPIPYFVYKDGQLTLDDSFRQDRSHRARSSWIGRLGVRLENDLRFVQATKSLIRSVKAWNRERKTKSLERSGPKDPQPVFEAGIDVQVYREPADDVWKRAWAVTDAILLEMQRDVVAANAQFFVATGSNGVQVLPETEVRDEFAKTLGVADLYYPDRRIAEFGLSNGISIITLAPSLAEYAEREKANLHGFQGNIGYGHWNQAGHRVAGEELGKRLCSELFK